MKIIINIPEEIGRLNFPHKERELPNFLLMVREVGLKCIFRTDALDF